MKLKKNCKKVTNDAIYDMIIFSEMTFKINAIKLYYLLSWPCMVGDYVDNRLKIFFYFFRVDFLVFEIQIIITKSRKNG